MNSSSDGPFSLDSKGERIDIETGVVFPVFSVFAVEAFTGDVWGVSVATGSEVRIDFLEQQDPIGSILEKYILIQKRKLNLSQSSSLSQCPRLNQLR